MSQLIECIPNFSEARRPEVVDAIVAEIEGVAGVRLLDRSSDLDHNRTVLTFAGPPAPVEEAAFLAIKKAADLIDLNTHVGAHPRIGATDVVPFVPIAEVSMQECVALARRLGERVGRELQIPVYLYENAAVRPERTNLENLRRGEYEGLRTDIETDPERKPDYGPMKLGKAGATVIGARDALIAFNVYLSTTDVGIAKRVAKAIRHSSGGMRFVKALGLLVDGKAQVSMNLTNFRATPLGRVVELVRREAARYGASVHHTELVGLIPQAALVDAAVWYTQMDGFSPDQVLESKLQVSAGVAGVPNNSSASAVSFLDDVAAAVAAPGGGSAAAYAGALGAALSEMVAGLTIGKQKYAKVEPEMLAVRTKAHRLRADLTQAVEDDAAAFGAVMQALQLPKDTKNDQRTRGEAVQSAMIRAAQVPLRTAAGAAEVMELAAECARDGNLNAISDAFSGAAMARAALAAAGCNVRINLQSLESGPSTIKMLEDLARLEDRADAAEREIVRTLHERARLA